MTPARNYAKQLRKRALDLLGTLDLGHCAPC